MSFPKKALLLGHSNEPPFIVLGTCVLSVPTGEPLLGELEATRGAIPWEWGKKQAMSRSKYPILANSLVSRDDRRLDS